jgi:hypothetical protein
MKHTHLHLKLFYSVHVGVHLMTVVLPSTAYGRCSTSHSRDLMCSAAVTCQLHNAQLCQQKTCRDTAVCMNSVLSNALIPLLPKEISTGLAAGWFAATHTYKQRHAWCTCKGNTAAPGPCDSRAMVWLRLGVAMCAQRCRVKVQCKKWTPCTDRCEPGCTWPDIA